MYGIDLIAAMNYCELIP